MWARCDSVSSLRFSKRDREELLHEGWNDFNADDYGVYRIQDLRNDVNLVFSIVRQDNDLSIRIEGDDLSIGENNNVISLIMYALPKTNSSSFHVDCPYSTHSGIVLIVIDYS